METIQSGSTKNNLAEGNESLSGSGSASGGGGGGAWADIVDTEISIPNKLLSSSSFDSVKNRGHYHNVKTTNMYNIADIMTKDPTTIKDLLLLEYQTYLSSHLKKYLKQCLETRKQQSQDAGDQHIFDFNLHLPKFDWLAKATRHLSDKLALCIVHHKVSCDMTVIPRSSYKFCEYNYDCQFNYKERYNGCFAQHFVYNLVHVDIVAMIAYLKYCREGKNGVNYDELVKCITTISYVIKHMLEELSNLQFHYGSVDHVHKEKSAGTSGKTRARSVKNQKHSRKPKKKAK
ncbi:MAG: hypothetical protein Harvfovirus21_11 [Harvfovirus sp.]|uniref:Uncharacterized protein n=1 Tax=Harvfovirus sp. TaxID=2487768 RepID=A0A3G5A407_9VIRU|nr:MAG: hypothetical protein Harvfovirus21_11 [Harvfovirus sp.]